MNRMTNVHGVNLVRWAKDRPEVVVLSGDLTVATEALGFKQAYPDRFYSLGLTEQNMMSWAAGMAREGYIPFVHTFSVFMYRRALDQIAISIAYPNLKVRMCGFLPGVTTAGGVTHQAIDDVNVMRGLPNMTILEAGDATDVEGMLDATEEVNGPVYMRLLRGELPRLFPKGERIKLNHARELSSGGDLTLISSGICTEEALAATSVLRNNGVGVRHLHVTTLKPFDDPEVIEALADAKHGVVTVENHSVIGGIGSAVAELMASRGISRPLVRIGIDDTFLPGSGQRYLMKRCEMDASSIVLRCMELVGERLDTMSASSIEDAAKLKVCTAEIHGHDF